MFETHNPVMHAEYRKNMAQILEKDPTLVPNFTNSVFACMCVNSGPKTATFEHRDRANWPNGWCVITPFGSFDPRRGGQIVFPQLKLIVNFPPGCPFFIPSAVLIHGNTPIQDHETRYSITQYSAGGLFRWAYNGFQTEEKFWRSLKGDALEREQEARRTRWKKFLKSFPIVPLASN